MGTRMWPPRRVVFTSFVFLAFLFRPGDSQMMFQQPQDQFSFMQNPFMMSNTGNMQQPQMMKGNNGQNMMMAPNGQMMMVGPNGQVMMAPNQQQSMFMQQPMQGQFPQQGFFPMNQQFVSPQQTAEESTSSTSTTAAPPTSSTTKSADDSGRSEELRAASDQPSSVLEATSDFMRKSKLFQISTSIIDPKSLASLKSQKKLTKFQIWWLTKEFMSKVDDRQKPDYVFMMPAPFQQGIPSVNMSQVLASPMVRHEVLRALIFVAPDMIPSQLAALLTQIRISQPTMVKDIMSSYNPGTLFSLINPREIRKNIQVIIRSIMEMPETGRFGVTSSQAKVLPSNVLNTWLKHANLTKWRADDLVGMTPLSVRLELDFAILGLSCRDLMSLPPVDVPRVVSFLRRELYSVRAVQDIGFPMHLRHCALQKVMEFAATKRSAVKGPHILDKLDIGDIKAIGGEVLSSIPIAALKSATPDTQFFVLSEIGRIDPISLLKFAPLKKIQWYGRTMFGEREPELVDTAEPPLEGRSAGSDAESSSIFDTDSAVANSTETKDSSSSAETTEKPAEGAAAGEDKADHPRSVDAEQEPGTAKNGTKSTEGDKVDGAKADTGSPDAKTTNGTKSDGMISEADKSSNKSAEGIDSSNPQKPRSFIDVGGGDKPIIFESSTEETTTSTTTTTEAPMHAGPYRRRRQNAPELANAETLSRMGSFFCYSTPLRKATWESATMKNFLESKESFGEKTCCMTKAMRSQWGKLLKTTYGSNITAWSEFDLAAVGDLIISLSDREIRSIPLQNLSRIASTLIKQSGFLAQIEFPGKEKKVSFVDACMDMLGDEDEAEAYRKSQKSYYKQLAHAMQWLITSEGSRGGKLPPTCDGIILSGHAATGYSVDDIQQIPAEALFDCVEPIAALDWDDETKHELLAAFKETFKFTSAQFNTLTLIEFANLVTELGPDDVSDIPFLLPDAMDTLAILGSQVRSAETLKAIGQKFSTDNRLSPGAIGLGRSINLKVVIRSLGNILCGMNEQVVKTIFDSDTTMLLETSPNVGKTEGCSATMLQMLAQHAMRPQNYGPPETWTPMDVRTLGVMVAGVPPEMLARIPPDSMEGLTPLAMKSFTMESLRALSPPQIRSITADAAQAMETPATDALAPEQAAAFKVVLAPSNDGFVADPRIASLAPGLQLTGLVGDADLSSVNIDEDAPAGPDVSDSESEDASGDVDARSAGEASISDSETFNSTSGLSDEMAPENGTVKLVEVDERGANATTLMPEESESNSSTSTTEIPPRQEGDIAPKLSAASHFGENTQFITIYTIFTIVITVIRNY